MVQHEAHCRSTRLASMVPTCGGLLGYSGGSMMSNRKQPLATQEWIRELLSKYHVKH